jgi:hypothetical protein
MSPSILDLATVYGPARTSSNVFWKASNRYTGGRHRGADYRKQNAAKTASVVTDLAAILDGEVVRASPAPGGALGGTIVIKGRDERGVVYEFHSHAVPGVRVGQKVASGDVIGHNASWTDPEEMTGRRVKRPGLSITWDGMHDHVVFSRYADGAWNTAREVLDPVPYIKRAIQAQRDEDPMANLTKDQLDQIAGAVWDRFGNTKLSASKALPSKTTFKSTNWAGLLRFIQRVVQAVLETVIRIEARQAAHIAATEALTDAIANNKGVDPKVVREVATKAVADAMKLGAAALDDPDA